MENLDLLAQQTPLLVILLTCLGLVIGSFLNVVIARVPAGESIVHPPSRCPKCGHAISWYENIPVVSWLLLRGRCSGCKAPISARYPLIELLTGLLFLGCWHRFGWTYELAPEGSGTRLTITENGEIYNPIFRFVARFVLGYTSTMGSVLRALGTKHGETVAPEPAGTAS